MAEMMPRTVPPAGWSPPHRAPRLRRAAELIELSAPSSPFPARALRVARDMRLRATALELAGEVEDLDAAIELIREAGGAGPMRSSSLYAESV